MKLPLEDIASENIQKARKFHFKGSDQRFDRKFSADERIPRQFDVLFTEKPLGSGVQVKIVKNGVNIGDALTDNAIGDDGYRYHDAFHLAFAAILGWSPVIRALLRRKRKSDAKVDEVEDGARAIIVEEAISIFLFNQSKSRNEFRDIRSIDIGLLKTVIRLCADLEVRKCTAKQWQSAIFEGYKIFRELRQNRGGIVSLDLDQAAITYVATKAPSRRGGKHARNPTAALPQRLASRRKAHPGKSR